MEKRIVYYIGFGFIIIALLLAGSVIFTANQNKSSSPLASPEVTISVPFTPVLKQIDNVVSISYDIETSRFADEGLNLIRAEVIDKETGMTLYTLDGESLRLVTHTGSGSLSSDKENLTDRGNYPLPRISVVLMQDSRAVPKILTHRLTFTSEERATLPFIITGGETPVLTGNVS